MSHCACENTSANSHCRASIRLPLPPTAAPQCGSHAPEINLCRPAVPSPLFVLSPPNLLVLARACLGMNLNVLCGARMLDAKLLSVVHSACGVSFCLSKTPRLFVFRLAAAGIRAGAAARKAEARTPSSRRGSPCRSCGACSATPTATRSCSRRPVLRP